MTRREEITKKALELDTTNDIATFVIAAQWADRTMIDKACKWLKENANKYIVDIGGRYETKLIVGGKCWDDFKQAMEDRL